MPDLLRENATGTCSREQLLVELIDWCHSLTAVELDADLEAAQEITDKIKAERFAASLVAQREDVRGFVASLRNRMEKASAFLASHIQTLEEQLSERSETNRLLSEARDALMTSLTHAESRVAELEERLAQAEQGEEQRNVESSLEEERTNSAGDVERHYQLALEDLQRERKKNAELQQQIAKLRTSGKTSAKPPESGWLDWETEKKRIVAALEADSAENTAAKKIERLGIEEVLRMTDEVIASKDREIRELKRQLADQSREFAVVPTPITESCVVNHAMDSDVVIQEERERLQTLQREWREKLRQAEIDISVERAKIARERSELDEQIRLVKDALAESHHGKEPGGPDQTTRGRWLAKLGLTAADREPPRQH